jgi:predicted amidohydrolase
MNTIVQVAAVQMNPKLMRNEKNLEKILLRIQEAAAKGVQLIVFPECALTGYLFRSREEALPYAETIPGPATDKITDLCGKLGVYVVFGLLEIDNGNLYNAAALIGPDGLIGKYRKTHIPNDGIDRFVEPGDKPFEVFRTPIANIGILICHDITFPESARILMLLGADIIVVPTNWPRKYDIVSKHMINTRAVENFVHIIACDRVGIERKGKFLGQSKVVNARGMTKVSGSISKEEILYSWVDIAFARIKFVPGFVEGKLFDIIDDRRPEFYGDIACPDAYKPAQ